MIIERAIFAIKPGQADDFEKAFALAAPLIRAAKGCRKANMHRGIENPDSFILLCEWDSVEDHMVGFRESPAFTEWRAILSPHFASPPAMEHYTAAL
ncbi:MAG: antibiotic biosynthesis monooxygenase [Alphaproteobacteria bacterium]|nr:antibiotic biosynthesis monooxygenase [Alphaproteobacteria bacterium]